jgi:hypothetical protein
MVYLTKMEEKPRPRNDHGRCTKTTRTMALSDTIAVLVII